MDNQNQNSSPQSGAEQPFVVAPTPLPGASPLSTLTPAEQSKPKKIMTQIQMISVACAVVVVALLGGAYLLKSQAISAANVYAKAVDAHFTVFFDKPTLAERVDEAKKIVVLQPIFMGSVLSERYNYAASELKPDYEKVMKASGQLSADIDAYGSFAKDIFKELQVILAATPPQIDTTKKTGEMESTLQAMLAKAKSLDTLANKIDKMEFLKAYTARDSLVEGLHKMALAQEGVVNSYLDMIKDLVDQGDATLSAAQKNVVMTSSFDSAPYVKKADGFIAQYKSASEDVVTSLTSIVDELLAKPYATDLNTRKTTLTTESGDIRAKVLKFIQ